MTQPWRKASYDTRALGFLCHDTLQMLPVLSAFTTKAGILF